jgi:hypothetical protein
VILHARLHIAYIERPQAMKTKSVLGSCILALLAAASVAAYAQMRTAETAGAQDTGDIVDAEGNLRVPADYRTGDPCRLRVAGHDRCVARMGGSRMALC